MSLSEAFEALGNPKIHFPQCKTCRWYLDLDPADKQFFDRKIEDPHTNMSRLIKACKEHSGLNIAPSSLRNHIESHHSIVKDA